MFKTGLKYPVFLEFLFSRPISQPTLVNQFWSTKRKLVDSTQRKVDGPTSRLWSTRPPALKANRLSRSKLPDMNNWHVRWKVKTKASSPIFRQKLFKPLLKLAFSRSDLSTEKEAFYCLLSCPTDWIASTFNLLLWESSRSIESLSVRSSRVAKKGIPFREIFDANEKRERKKKATKTQAKNAFHSR